MTWLRFTAAYGLYPHVRPEPVEGLVVERRGFDELSPNGDQIWRGNVAVRLTSDLVLLGLGGHGVPTLRTTY